MTAAAQRTLSRLERLALIAGAVALLASAILGWLTPRGLLPAYRLAAFACLAPALGSLLFQLILRLTGGQWGLALHPFLIAGSRLLPWIWLLTLPLLFFPHTAFESTAPHDLYSSRLFFVARALLYFALFASLAFGLGRVRRARRAGDHASLRWVAPAGLITLVFSLHLLVDDWLVALDPGWHSTAFPAVWMTGQALAGLALAVVAAVLTGAEPSQIGPARRALGLDWGNLLLASTMFFAYVAFAQFLIIWSGNLPREISWYQLRTHGRWSWVIVALAVVHFALPFAALLSRRLKRSRVGLAGIALLLLLAQLTYLAWLILPPLALPDWRALALAFALPVAALALFFNRYLAAARRMDVAP